LPAAQPRRLAPLPQTDAQNDFSFSDTQKRPSPFVVFNNSQNAPALRRESGRSKHPLQPARASFFSTTGKEWGLRSVAFVFGTAAVALTETRRIEVVKGACPVGD
jgi:hypothetical protein